MNILVVDDEAPIRDSVARRLNREGYTVFTADSAEEAQRQLKAVRPKLVVLDVMLPKQSGYEFCRNLRATSATPVLFLSARAGEDDRIKGLELGGDDYMVKPFSLSELALRVKSILRRSDPDSAPELIEVGDLKIDPVAHEAFCDGKKLELSPKEFALLRFLAKNAGRVFPREIILDRVWDPETYVSPRTVDVHIRWLRERIEDNPSHPTRLVTVRGVGYKLTA